MPRRTTSTRKDGSIPVNSAKKASTMRTTAAKDGTDGTKPKLPGSKARAVSGKTSSSVGQKGSSRTTAASKVKSAVGYSTPGHSGGLRGGEAPKLGRSGSAVSGLTGGSFGVAKATNQSAYKPRSGAVSGKVDESWGQAPARNRSSEPYGTAPAKGSHHQG